MKRLMIALCTLLTLWGVCQATEESVAAAQILILLGPPASGKGTQAARLAQELGVPHISTGDLFRDHIKRQTPLGLKVKATMDAGQLVSDDLVLELLDERLSRPDAARGYVLDGVPRTLYQAQALDARLPKNGQVHIVNLIVSDDTILKRTSGRLSCTACGKIYNVYFSPPTQPGTCDVDTIPLLQRPDDAPAAVQTRLKAYHEQTAPLVSYYGSQNRLQEVNGEQDPNTVFNEILQKIHSK